MSRTFTHPETGERLPDQRRGDSLTYKWLTGILITILTLGGTGWMSNLHAQVLTLSKSLTNHEARLASIHTSLMNIESRLVDVQKSILRLEDRVQAVRDRTR